jgi:intracellular multiplication protein IcmB
MGLITLLKNALPIGLKTLVAGYRLRATPDYAINPLDAPLGLRAPLPSHLAFLVNFLCLLATPLGQSAPPDGTAGIVRVALEAAYAEACDPGKPFDQTLAPELAEKAFAAGFAPNEASAYWDLTDYFFKKGLINEAHEAQRLASPTLADVVAQVRRSPGLKATYGFKVALTGENILDYVWRSLTEAIGEYRILAKPTRFSVGEARIVSLDLDEVAPRGGGPAGDKRAAVMYMLARHAVGARFFLTPADVPLTPPLYREHHRQNVQNLRQTPKRLCYDEVHRLTGLKAASAQLVADLTTSARESRKWNLSIGLYSQAPEDFPAIFQELATAVFVLGVGTQAGLDDLTKTYGFNESVALGLSRLSPPGPRGSSLAALFKTQSGRTQDLLTLALSPELRWAFSTTAEDAAIRDELYRRFGVERTLSALATRWPAGLKPALEERAAQSGSTDRRETLAQLIEEAASQIESRLN